MQLILYTIYLPDESLLYGNPNGASMDDTLYEDLGELVQDFEVYGMEVSIARIICNSNDVKPSTAASGLYIAQKDLPSQEGFIPVREAKRKYTETEAQFRESIIHRVREYLEKMGQGIYKVVLRKGYSFDPQEQILLKSEQENTASVKEVLGIFSDGQDEDGFYLDVAYRRTIKIPYTAVSNLEKLPEYLKLRFSVPVNSELL
ncbi:hypothetical protein HYX03_02120 [Candidatus Woesearchaeota archaeon]|nr:hypothetical protein [Candidatus Woesearchaeota archaeon]